MQALLPSYLEFSIDRFTGEQQKMREAARAFSPNPFSPPTFGALEELTRKNLAAFHNALSVFTPFAGVAPPAAAATPQVCCRRRKKQSPPTRSQSSRRSFRKCGAGSTTCRGKVEGEETIRWNCRHCKRSAAI